MHRLVYRRLNRGDAVLDRLLHLLEGAHLDLARSLARHAELVGELRKWPMPDSAVTIGQVAARPMLSALQASFETKLSPCDRLSS